eukprot:343341-Alexandrium_andersonii.AAC.1
MLARARRCALRCAGLGRSDRGESLSSIALVRVNYATCRYHPASRLAPLVGVRRFAREDLVGWGGSDRGEIMSSPVPVGVNSAN